MSGPNFESLLTRPVEEAKRPPSIPACTAFGTIKAFAFGESRFANDDGSKNVQVTFTLVPTDIQEEHLKEEIANLQPPLNSRQLRAELPLSGGNEWITRELLEKLGIDVKRSWRECIPDAVGQRVMFSVTQRADKNNPEVFYNDVRNVRAVPA